MSAASDSGISAAASKPSKRDGLIGVAGIRRHLRAEPLERAEATRLPVRGEFHGDEVQDTGSDDLVDQGMTLADRQGCPGVVDLAGADSEQRLSMAHRDFGLVLDLAVRASRLEDQQTFLLFEANPGGAIPLLGKEAFDVAQATSFAPDQAGEGWGEEKAAANGHETQAM